jgi:hypothetical protein
VVFDRYNITSEADVQAPPDLRQSRRVRYRDADLAPPAIRVSFLLIRAGHLLLDGGGARA